jgi:predicted nucleic acid-binding protein
MRPRRPRAVLDTQLLIRAFHTARGATGGLVRALQDDRFHFISSEPLLDELRRTFYRPEVQRIAPLRPLLPHEIEDNIASVRAIAAVVVPGRYQVDLVSTDPKDNPSSHAPSKAWLVLPIARRRGGGDRTGARSPLKKPPAHTLPP